MQVRIVPWVWSKCTCLVETLSRSFTASEREAWLTLVFAPARHDPINHFLTIQGILPTHKREGSQTPVYPVHTEMLGQVISEFIAFLYIRRGIRLSLRHSTRVLKLRTLSRLCIYWTCRSTSNFGSAGMSAIFSEVISSHFKLCHSLLYYESAMRMSSRAFCSLLMKLSVFAKVQHPASGDGFTRPAEGIRSRKARLAALQVKLVGQPADSCSIPSLSISKSRKNVSVYCTLSALVAVC